MEFKIISYNKQPMNKALIEDSKTKIAFIISQEIREENKNDSKLAEIIRLLFTTEQKSKRIISFPDIEKEAQDLLCKLIELIYILFKMPEKERDQLFRTEVTNIKNSNIIQIITELEELQKVEIELPNKKYDNLCDIIISSLFKDKYNLIEYIDTVLANLSSFPGLITLLKFELYTIIMNKYFILLGTKIYFHETEINVEDELSLEIILDLFQKDQGNDLVFIQSLIILKYKSLKNFITKYNMSQISNALQNTFNKITNGIEISRIIYVEKILMIFREELQNLNSKNKKKRKNKKKKKNKESSINTNTLNTASEKIENIIDSPNNKKEQTEPTKKIRENNPEQSPKAPFIKDDKTTKNISQKEINSSIQLKKNEFKDEIESKEEENDNKIKKGDISKKYINDLFLQILKMADNTKEILDKLKNIFDNLLDKNDKMEQKFEKMNNSMQKKINDMQKEINDLIVDKQCLQKKINDMQKQINDLTENNEKMNEIIVNQDNRIEILENTCDEFKEVLGNIQTRDFSKRLLKSFNRYLISDDFKRINENKDKSLRGKIITERIEKKFCRFKKSEKMKMLINLIKNCSDSLVQGNDYAHSLSIDIYEEDIEQYKLNKKINTIDSLDIFCFLIGLGINDEYIDESFDFLTRFFDNDMKYQGGKSYLESYFK